MLIKSPLHQNAAKCICKGTGIIVSPSTGKPQVYCPVHGGGIK